MFRKSKVLLLALTGLLSLTAFAATHRDGTYRGNFLDRGENQVTVEFKLEDDIVTSAKYRGLEYRGVNYLKEEKVAVERAKHEALLTHLVGRNIDESLDDLYNPGDIEMAGATIRSNKVRSAIKDALNRGAYKLAK